MDEFKSVKKPTIMLLGTFHMASTQDLINVKVDGLSSSPRQQEILEAVARIKKFTPTKVALEVPTKKNEGINQRFQEYLAGNIDLPINEIYQIGFRIAADLSHKQIYCIDWMEQGAGTKSAGEVYEWAKEHQPQLFQDIYGRLLEQQRSPASSKSILEMYRDCNDPVRVRNDHTMYINMARIGKQDEYIGMEWLIWWYQRNLIMFSNLTRLLDSDEERVLFIVGSSHVQILSQFLEESGLVDVEAAAGYLN
ncbi:DUF5694 domain-containing protein [Paenibacillus senegalensis]|nr:DUF5694 domain-containing protein [Paenibacillus senegalensis]